MESVNVGQTIIDFLTKNWQLFAVLVAAPFVSAYVLRRVFSAGREGDPRASSVSPLRAAIVRMLGNWRVALLGLTGIVLSIASGWTTWDGMRNFTAEPLLSLMITFGIQGVMLICAWLIGETFARGAMGKTDSADAGETASEAMRSAVKLSFAALVALLVLFVAGWIVGSNVPGYLTNALAGNGLWIVGGVAVAMLVGFVLVSLSSTEIVGPYARGGRIVLANLHLWVMFLACMSTSVFFSFDSLFSSIFPPEERKRAADIRAINQVASTVAEIGSRIQRVQLDETKTLFESKAWLAYESQLDQVRGLAEKAPSLIREQISKELEERKQRVAALEEKRANAQGAQAGLATRKSQLTDELSRITGERPDAATQTQEYKSVVAGIQKRLDEQRAKTMAEEKGVEGSGKVGRGQFWRASRSEEEKIVSELEVAQQRLKSHESRLTRIDKRISTIRAELAQIDGDLAKLRGEAQTAEQLLTVTVPASAAGKSLQGADPSFAVGALDRERQAFRLDPKQDILASVQRYCSVLLEASAKVESLREEATRLDCDPKQASEVAARIFALNDGLVAFQKNCMGGDRLPQRGGTEALLGFGRKCLQDSGLPSKDSAEIGALFSSIDLNRDDKAHRFVVTWNAFNDGNRLAYLALAIAIAIDGLVFMSGLFGANAISSPLTAAPEARRRSVSDLHSVIDSALWPPRTAELPNGKQIDTTELALHLMEPVRLAHLPAFSVMVDLNPVVSVSQKLAVRKVLTAATGLGLVNHVPHFSDLYLVRRELHEYLLKFAQLAHKRGDVADPMFTMPQLDMTRAQGGIFLSNVQMQAVPDERHIPAGLGGGEPRDITPIENYAAERVAVSRGVPSSRGGTSSAGEPATPRSFPPRVRSDQDRDASPAVETGRRETSRGDLRVIPGSGGPAVPRISPSVPTNFGQSDPITPVAEGAGFNAREAEDELLSIYLKQLDISEAGFEALSRDDTAADVTDAVYGLEAVAAADREIEQRLKKLLDQKNGVIAMLRQRLPDSASVADDLRGNVQSLLLFGDKGYKLIIDEIVGRMEHESEGVLPKAQELRLQYLRAHQQNLSDIWPLDRGARQTWRRLAESMGELAGALSQIKTADDAIDGDTVVGAAARTRKLH